MSEGPRFKVIGLVVGIAVVALAAGFFLLSGGQSSSNAASTHTVIPLSQRKHAKRAKAKHARPAVKPVAKPKPKPAKPPAPAAAQDGLPPALTAALARHRIVVVSLYAPKVELDDMALQEAKAGAAGAGAGFVALNVMSEAESRQLTKQLGVLEDPAVLVFKRPGDLVTRFSGFADQQTILQAARNAAL
jgi:thiol:disulfide interchange protein